MNKKKIKNKHQNSPLYSLLSIIPIMYILTIVLVINQAMNILTSFLGSFNYQYYSWHILYSVNLIKQNHTKIFNRPCEDQMYILAKPSFISMYRTLVIRI